MVATISRDYVSGVISVAAERALLGDWAAARGKWQWQRKRGSGGDGGKVVAVMTTAAINSGENGSSAMAVAAERALLGDWAATQGIRRWRRKRGSGGDGGTVAAVTAAAEINSDDNGSGAMARAADWALLGEWAAAQRQRWRQQCWRQWMEMATSVA